MTGAPAIDHSSTGLSSPLTVWPGRPYPLGATLDGEGCNFSVFSEVAQRVELCLLDGNGRETRIDLPEVRSYCWHGYVPGIRAGQRYGFRVHGPWDPSRGLRCNPHKLLLDPYARGIDGTVTWTPEVLPYAVDAEGRALELVASSLDSACCVPHALVIDPTFDWSGDQRLDRPLHQTDIYELHVKGFTAQLRDVPPELRGTYAGLAHPASVAHLTRLGIGAVELLPVHQFVHDRHVTSRGLRNYWGYNSIGFFAPHHEYSSAGSLGGQVQEFKGMVRTLHRAGIEVFLDVVYNHTGEGDHLGPVLSLRGLDNAAYYRLLPEDARQYLDFTGTGNSLNMRHPHVLQLLMDSLRYWVTEMHVDGFRFDLAATLGRELHAVDKLAAFFDLVQQDPVVSQVKLIAEPWDVGEGGYNVGKFPPLWSEWNGRFRDVVRDYWRGTEHTLAEFAQRFVGSPDLYAQNGRRPSASVNFVTCHDGFTLRDLVSYDRKHNTGNREDNRDGENHNRSWNGGVEGPTDDHAVITLRRRQQRNFLTTLLLAQGVPMLTAGDELGRTQGGNNNAYCQDNEISWIDWQHADQALLAFTTSLLAFRRAHPVFRRRRWFEGPTLQGPAVRDIVWFTPAGCELTDADWHTGFAKSLMVFLNGNVIPSRGPRGEAIVDDSFLLCFNAHDQAVTFSLPQQGFPESWRKVIDTTAEGFLTDDERVAPHSGVSVSGRAVAVLQVASSTNSGTPLARP